MKLTDLTLPVTVVASLGVSLIGGTATAIWWVSGLYNRVEKLDIDLTRARADFDRLKTQISADAISTPRPNTVLNTNAGIACGKNEAITQLSVSAVNFTATFTCVSVRPDIR